MLVPHKPPLIGFPVVFYSRLSEQMEYCEKSTLRDTIDEGLHKDSSRLWRLFREILDGLAYIHEQVLSEITSVYMLP